MCDVTLGWSTFYGWGEETKVRMMGRKVALNFEDLNFVIKYLGSIGKNRSFSC